MSFLESPKNRFKSFDPGFVAAPMNSTHIAKPGCVQCGSLLELPDSKHRNLSGKCFTCEYCISDEGECEFDEGEY